MLPIAPPSASISRTNCPLALPPIDGLQGNVQILSGSPVTSIVGTPKRADANAASTPAWPPPTTIVPASSNMKDQPVEAALIAAECPRKRNEKAVVKIPNTIAYALMSQTSASAPASGNQTIK